MADLDHDFTGADDDPWDPAVFTMIGSWLGSSPDPTIQGNKGEMVTGGSGLGIGDRHSIMAYTSDTYTDTEIIVQMQSMTMGGFPGIGWRVDTWTGGEFNPISGYALQWNTAVNNVDIYDNETNFLVAFARDLTNLDHADVNWWRIYSRGTRHRIKWWPVGTTEPPTWFLDFVDANHAGPGHIYLTDINTNGGFPSTTVWDDLHVGEILPPPPGIRVGLGTESIVGMKVAISTSTASPVIEAYLASEELVPIPIVVPEA